MYTLRRIGALSYGKISAAIGVGFGLIIGALFSLFSVLEASMASGTDAGVMSLMLGAGAIIVLPIIYGVLMFISGVIGAWIYNIAAGIVGGVEIELHEPAPGHASRNLGV